MTPDEIVNGWNAVFVACGLASAYAAFGYLRDLADGHGLTVKRIVHYMPARLTAGFILMVLGYTVRIGGWLPWRGMRAAGDLDAARAYADLATIWTTGGAWLCATGLALIFWPATRARFGAAAWFAVPVLLAITFAAGVSMTALHSVLF